jgi:hypothetical protein
MLQVFEWLKNGLDLPLFDRDNWRSNIRGRVNVHPGYGDLINWVGPETSDIIYEDSSSAFTAMLINKGYLTSSVWLGRTPTYYIEVKATFQSCNSTFYCSQNQYNRLESMQLSENTPADEVYMFVRVFKLSHAQPGLKIYLDPATLRRNEELQFRSDRYSITPL